MEGWIKLHRSLLSWRWASSPPHLSVFINLILRCNYKESEWPGVALLPGQILTGRTQLCEWTGLTEAQVRKVLNDLENDQQINRQTTNKYSIITIAKWDSFQEDNQQTTNKQPANSQQTTSKTPANNQQTRPKNAKKEKNTDHTSCAIDEVATQEEKVKIPSPLVALFDGHERAKEIQSWLLSGDLKPQEELFTKYDPTYLMEVIEDSYDWKVENNKKRKAGRYITAWIERDSRRKFKGGLTEFQMKLQNFITENNLQKYVVQSL